MIIQTIQDFHIAIDLELDKTQDYEVPYMTAEQKDYWLNKGIRRLVKQRYTGNTLSNKGFEQTQKRIDDLRDIVNYPQDSTGTPILSPVTQSGNNYYQELPTDYWFLVRLDIGTQVGNCATQLNPGLQVKQDTVNNIQEDPFNRAYNEIPVYYLIGNRIIFPTDGSFTIVGATPYYVAEPAEVRNGTAYADPETDLQCNLNSQLYDEIVDTTVFMLLENIEQQRLQNYAISEREQE